MTEISGGHLAARALKAEGVHRCAMRARTIGENDRTQRSIIDHMHMMTALEDRDADLTACFEREHTLGWAAPMEENATYLDEGQRTSALG